MLPLVRLSTGLCCKSVLSQKVNIRVHVPYKEPACWAATLGSAGGLGSGDAVPQLPPGLEHGWLPVDRRHRVDTVRKAIHALNSQRALVFMNFAARLKARSCCLHSPG